MTLIFTAINSIIDHSYIKKKSLFLHDILQWTIAVNKSNFNTVRFTINLLDWSIYHSLFIIPTCKRIIEGFKTVLIFKRFWTSCLIPSINNPRAIYYIPSKLHSLHTFQHLKHSTVMVSQFCLFFNCLSVNMSIF
jgi:hypothetical protein